MDNYLVCIFQNPDRGGIIVATGVNPWQIEQCEQHGAVLGAKCRDVIAPLWHLITPKGIDHGLLRLAQITQITTDFSNVVSTLSGAAHADKLRSNLGLQKMIVLKTTLYC